MPYRCQKCMNTFKTLSLYNRHAVDCKHIKGETKTTSTTSTTIGSSAGRSSQVRTVQSFGGSGSAVVKRNFSDSGIGQSSYSPQPQNKRINAKIEFKAYKGNNGNSYSNDDEITIIDNNSTVKQEVKPSASTIVEIKKPYRNRYTHEDTCCDFSFVPCFDHLPHQRGSQNLTIRFKGIPTTLLKTLKTLPSPPKIV